MTRTWPVALALTVVACGHRPPPAPEAVPHYVVGPAYQMGGVWSYPQERFRYDATGLAERLPPRSGLTDDGERAGANPMAGAHRTLQLPAVVDVTNLDNGRQVRIRLDDRGPATPGRLIGLSGRAADLLGLPPTGAAPVRVTLDVAESEALRDQLGGGPRGITAAPVTAVAQEDLGPPGRPRIAGAAAVRAASAPAATVPTALPALPETVRTVAAQPGQLWIRVGEFTRERYAEALRNRLSGVPARVTREGGGRQPTFVVMAGPFASVSDADAGLDRVRAAGVTDAPIVVE